MKIFWVTPWPPTALRRKIRIVGRASAPYPSPMTTPVKLDLTSSLLLFALASVWGGSFFFAEIALAEVPPLTITLHRVFWAAPLLVIIVHLAGYSLPKDIRIWGAYLGMGALNNAIPFSLIFWGQSQIDSGLASILNGTTAMFGAVVAGLLLRDEPLTLNKLAGAGLGLIGVGLIMGPEALLDFNLANLAQMAILAASLSYAFASVWGKTFLSSQPPLMNACGMVIGSSVLMIPLVLTVDGMPSFALSAPVWAALLSLSSLSTVLAYGLYFAILKRAGAANLMLVTLLIPPFAIALGSGFLGERLPSSAWVGFAVIAIGFAVTDGRMFGKR